MSKIHIVGAGLAGLSTAVTATGSGREVALYEAAAMAGGRCRSFFDKDLGITINNGNHLVLSGNKSTVRYIDAIGASKNFTKPKAPLFPFFDVKTGRRWELRPNLGRIPWWIFDADRRVPKTTAAEHLSIRHVGRDWDDTVMSEATPHNSLYWLLLEPLSIAALNTRPHEALACLFGAVLRETLLKGGRACLPLVATEGLSEALVNPALDVLRQRRAEVWFNRRVTGLRIAADRVTGLLTTDGTVALEPDDTVILAVPPWIVTDFLPDLTVPNAFESILNVHFKISPRPRAEIAEAGFLGLVNATAEWIFVWPDHLSVTVSAANKLIDQSADALAQRVWRDVVKAFASPELNLEEMPPFRVIKERRATIVANVEQEERRPGARTDFTNLLLAGDWTDTRLPATIEGAIRSGVTAARLALAPSKA